MGRGFGLASGMAARKAAAVVSPRGGPSGWPFTIGRCGAVGGGTFWGWMELLSASLGLGPDACDVPSPLARTSMARAGGKAAALGHGMLLTPVAHGIRPLSVESQAEVHSNWRTGKSRAIAHYWLQRIYIIR